MNDSIAEPFIDRSLPTHVADHGVPERVGSITYYRNLVQGSDEWFRIRCGLLTASEMKLAITPTLKVANNEKVRTHIYELAAQRISSHVEPTYVGEAMLRGHDDEIEARIIYSQEIEPVREMGFVTNDKWGFTLGYSPDGLVGEKGGIEAKSRAQKYQIQTICEHAHDDKSASIPADFMIQCQTGMMVAELDWLDFISYSGGLPMVVIRVYPDPDIQVAILDAAEQFEEKVQERIAAYHACLKFPETRAFPTERRIEGGMYL